MLLRDTKLVAKHGPILGTNFKLLQWLQQVKSYSSDWHIVDQLETAYELIDLIADLYTKTRVLALAKGLLLQVARKAFVQSEGKEVHVIRQRIAVIAEKKIFNQDFHNLDKSVDLQTQCSYVCNIM